jgi:hypothetical protein
VTLPRRPGSAGSWTRCFRPWPSGIFCRRAKSRSCARASTSGATPSSTVRSSAKWPYLWLDAACPRRPRRRIVSVAAMIALAVSTEGRCESSSAYSLSEPEPFWSDQAWPPAHQGLVISDWRPEPRYHSRARRDLAKVRVHWIRNALPQAPKGRHTMVAAAIGRSSCATRRASDLATCRRPAPASLAKLAALMYSEHEVLACMPSRPAQHRSAQKLPGHLPGRTDMDAVLVMCVRVNALSRQFARQSRSLFLQVGGCSGPSGSVSGQCIGDVKIKYLPVATDTL